MQSYARLIENVHGTHQRTAQGSGQLNALELAARQRVGKAVEREVAQAHAHHVLEAVIDFGQDALTDLLTMFVKFKVLEKIQSVFDGFQHQVGDGSPRNLHVGRILPQPRAPAVRASGAAPVARQHYPVLDFVGLFFYFLEKIVQPLEMCVARPEQIFFSLTQILVRAVNREVEADTVTQQRFEPLAHFFRPPGRNGPLENGKPFVGNHQVGIDAQHLTKAFATPASTVGIVETEQIDARLLEQNAVQLEFVGKSTPLLTHDFDHATAFTFEEGGLHRVRKAVLRVFVVVLHGGAVDEDEKLLGFGNLCQFFAFQHFFDELRFAAA